MRRQSDMNFGYLPGQTSYVGVNDSDSDYEADEMTYEFPLWWFIFICVPSFPGRLFGNAL